MNVLLNLLFPKLCIGCASPGAILCQKCETHLPKNDHQYSTNQPYLKALISSCQYEPNKLVQQLIFYLKYKGNTEVAYILANLLMPILQTHPEITPPYILVPIPLHKKRLRERGYNQSEILANALATKLNEKTKRAETISILERTSFKKPQAELNRRERFINIQNCFVISKETTSILQPISRKGTIILIDDVATTGATINEAALTLQNAGINNIFGATIARQLL